MKMSVITLVLAAFTMVSHAKDNDGGIVKIGAKGKIAIVDTTRQYGADIGIAVKKLSTMLMLNVEHNDGGQWSIAESKRAYDKTGATFAVFVVKDESLPISLLALESRWAVVNSSRLSPKLVGKEVVRMVTALLGGGYAKFPASTMRPVFSVDDLESKAGDGITFDSIMSIFPNLESLGLSQFKTMTYRDACEEKVAPRPANDIQKKIWKEYNK